MKKIIATCFIVLAVSALLCVAAFAADTQDKGIYKVTQTTDYNVTATFYSVGSNGEKSAVNPSSATIDGVGYTDFYKDAELLQLDLTVSEPAAYYLVLATKDSQALDSGTIIYIDQTSGAATISFTVYPSQLAKENYVYLAESNGTGRKLVLTFKYESGVLLGDVDGNGKVELRDALWTLQTSNGKRTLTDREMQAADVVKDGRIKLQDALYILQASNGKRVLS